MVVAIFAIIASGNKTEKITTEDISTTRSIKAIHLVSKYKPEIIKTKVVTTLSEIKNMEKICLLNLMGL